MTFEQYIPLAVRTLNNLGSRKKNLAHMGLGLASECLEFKIALDNKDIDNALEEISDMSWFTASSFHLLGIEYNQHKQADLGRLVITTQLSFNISVQEVVNLIKKHFAYGIPILGDGLIDQARMWYCSTFNKKCIRKKVFEECLYKLVAHYKNWSEGFKEDYSIVLESNIDKLKKRYPKGYSDYHAATRLDKDGDE